ncbi:hypothetical protein BJX64DRAFT_262821 [Aspergillus heterothallicus]
MPMGYFLLRRLDFGSLILFLVPKAARILEIRFAALTCAIPALLLEVWCFGHRIILVLLLSAHRSGESALYSKSSVVCALKIGSKMLCSLQSGSTVSKGIPSLA